MASEKHKGIAEVICCAIDYYVAANKAAQSVETDVGMVANRRDAAKIKLAEALEKMDKSDD